MISAVSYVRELESVHVANRSVHVSPCDHIDCCSTWPPWKGIRPCWYRQGVQSRAKEIYGRLLCPKPLEDGCPLESLEDLFQSCETPDLRFSRPTHSLPYLIRWPPSETLLLVDVFRTHSGGNTLNTKQNSLKLFSTGLIVSTMVYNIVIWFKTLFITLLYCFTHCLYCTIVILLNILSITLLYCLEHCL